MFGDARLTSREWEVLDLLAHGLSTADIARELTISTSAVRVHIAAIVRKLGVPDRAGAVAMLRGPGGGAGDAAVRGAAGGSNAACHQRSGN